MVTSQIIEPLTNSFTTCSLNNYSILCLTVKSIVNNNYDDVNKKIIIQSLLPIFQQIIPSRIQYIFESSHILLLATIKMIKKVFKYLSNEISIEDISNIIDILFTIFRGNVYSILTSNNDAIISCLNTFIKIIVFYTKVYSERDDIDEDIYQMIMLNAFTFCSEDIYKTLSEITIGNETFRTCFSLLFTVIDCHWDLVNSSQDFFDMSVAMILTGLKQKDIEMVRELIKMILNVNYKHKVFKHEYFINHSIQFAYTLLSLIELNEHSSEELILLFYTIITSTQDPILFITNVC